MLNYLKADFYRIFNKKSMYITFVSFFVLYCLLVFIQSSSLTAKSIIDQADYVFMFLAILGGGYLFATIYNEDLTAKSLPSIIGFGIKRTTIIISKIIVNIIMTAILFVLGYVALHLVFRALGFNIDGNSNIAVIKTAVSYLLRLWAYGTIASIVVYGTQKATMSIVAFVLLVTGFVGQILFLLLNQFKEMLDLTKFTIIPIVFNLIEKPIIVNMLAYLIYVIVFVVLSIIAFRSKDLEF